MNSSDYSEDTLVEQPAIANMELNESIKGRYE